MMNVWEMQKQNWKTYNKETFINNKIRNYGKEKATQGR